MTQPIALRLAEDLEKHVGGNIAFRSAAELRRLHEVNTELVEELHEVEGNRDDWKESTILANQRFKLAEEKLAGLRSLNQELLEALRQIKVQSCGSDWTHEQALNFCKTTAKEALAKAKGEQA